MVWVAVGGVADVNAKGPLLNTCGCSRRHSSRPHAITCANRWAVPQRKFKIIVNGCGIGGSNDYITDVNTNGLWVAQDFTFTTGTLAAAQNVFFNSCEGYGGTLAFLDNFELYDMSSVKVNNIVTVIPPKVFIQRGNIVVNFELNQPSNVEFSVYNIQGILLAKQKANYSSGSNHTILDVNLSSGLFIVKIVQNGKVSTHKVIK